MRRSRPDAGPRVPAEAGGPKDRDPDQVAAPPSPNAAADIVDVFVYVVVLNLFVQYFPSVISETFTLSLLTAVLLKAVLEVVVAAKNRGRKHFRAATTPLGKAAAGVMLWAVLIGSKFLVLKSVDLVFGTRVSLGGFLSVTLLIVTLLLSRAGVRRLLHGARPQARVASSPADEPDATDEV